MRFLVWPLAQEAKMLARDHKKRFRSGERIPSNAWARKIAAPTKPITAVTVSNIANLLYATVRQKTAATLHSQKDFRGTNAHPDRSRGFCATGVIDPNIVA
jgi:hypothetical protein